METRSYSRCLFAILALLPVCAQHAAAQCVTPSTNIASWWRAEQNTSDAVGGNNGTITNGVVYVTGKVGYAFLQTNSGAAVIIGNPENLQLQNFSVEGWIRRYSTTIVSSESDNGLFFSFGTGGYGFGIQPNGLIFLTKVEYSQVPASGTTPGVTDTNWHHLAVTVTNSVVWIYIDSIPTEVSSAYAPNYYFSTEAAVGARGDSQDCSFYGALDEMGVYSNALSSNQVWAIYNAGTNGGYGKCVPSNAPEPPCSTAPTNLVTWWRGESNALDSITGITATLTNGVTYTNGEVDYAFSQAASGAAVIVGNPAYLQLQNFTIEGWVQRYSTTYASSQHDNGLIFGYGTGGYAFAMQPAGTLFLTKVGYNERDSTLSVTDTNWHHVAVTISGTVVSNYLDGTGVLASSTYSSGGFSFTTNAAIGARGDDPYDCSFLGAIDELSVYNRALTSNEVIGIYNQGHAGKCGPDITSQPVSQAVSTGDNVTFSVSATASWPVTYQWQFNGANITGATASSYSITGATLASAGIYSVIVSDYYASLSSANATLTVPDDLGLHVFIDQPLGISEVP